ncbi:MAG: Rpn family recombination-promoting nuclease/putative transposase [Coriobacteriales bacterium]|jgi:predicted transposase/invertase (TIGR01784 family)|nr:Rpn family recombination-promoting nuclease/putative transposase [Coriobacteriales bacterium]
MPRHHLPTNDLLFKRSLANASHPDVTAGFIHDLLGLEVSEVHIENPYDIQVFRDSYGKGGLRPTIVDVRVRLKDRSQVIAEMQVERQSMYLERGLYYPCSRYIEDYGNPGLDTAESKYDSLNPIYSIHVLDFLQFDGDSDPLRNFSLYDTLHNEFYGDRVISDTVGGLFNLTFLELGKDRQSVPEHVRHWMDFFKGRPLPESVPDYLKKALELSEEHNLTHEEAQMISDKERAEQDRIGQLEYARDEGLRKGRWEGRQEGQRESALSNAQRALSAGLAEELVQQITNLDLKTIRKLKATGFSS